MQPRISLLDIFAGHARASKSGREHGHATSDACEPGARQTLHVPIVEFRYDVLFLNVVETLGVASVDLLRARPSRRPPVHSAMP
jgi:hypothetical protein